MKKKLLSILMLSMMVFSSFTIFSCKEPENPNFPSNDNDDELIENGSQLSTFTVKFFYDDGSKVSDDVKEKKVGEKVTLPTVKEISGKEFSGWFFSSTNSGAPISTEKSGASYTVSAEDAKGSVISLYALYYDINNFLYM